MAAEESVCVYRELLYDVLQQRCVGHHVVAQVCVLHEEREDLRQLRELLLTHVTHTQRLQQQTQQPGHAAQRRQTRPPHRLPIRTQQE